MRTNVCSSRGLSPQHTHLTQQTGRSGLAFCPRALCRPTSASAWSVDEGFRLAPQRCRQACEHCRNVSSGVGGQGGGAKRASKEIRSGAHRRSSRCRRSACAPSALQCTPCQLFTPMWRAGRVRELLQKRAKVGAGRELSLRSDVAGRGCSCQLSCSGSSPVRRPASHGCRSISSWASRREGAAG
jgi:hypothetical protein